jgi:16S rRNA (guanine527-N7)-methyltransferase
MFHVEHVDEDFEAIERWLGIDIDASQRAALLQFGRWLADEAMPAGGIGPAEGDRLFDRHIVDSLAFETGFPENARYAIDVGGGVGLPSLPLAIVRPDIEFTLVDRSQKRTDLARRATRILGLRNHEIVTGDVDSVDGTFDVALFRASLPIERAAESLSSLLAVSGVGLFGVSRQIARPVIPKAPEGITFALSQEGDNVLQTPFWLLEMRRI